MRSLLNDAETVLASTPFLLTRCSADLRYVFASQAYAAMIGRRPEDIAGKKIVDIMGEQGFATILPHVEAVLSGRCVEYETDVHFAGIGKRLLHVIYTPEFDTAGRVRGWIASILDITEKRHAEARAAADLHAMTRLFKVGVLCLEQPDAPDRCLDEVIDVAVDITRADKGNIQLFDPAAGALQIAAQRGFEKPFLQFFAGIRDADTACGTAMQRGERVIVEDVLQSEIFAGRPSLKVLLHADVRAVQSMPLKSSSGRLLGMISTHFAEPHRPAERELRLMDLLARQTADYLERKQASDLQRTLTSELQHRTNNLLAVVQTIVNRTLSGGYSLDEAKDIVEARLRALARANKQLTKSDWSGLTLAEIINAELEPYLARCKVDGAAIVLGRQYAQNFSLVLHELATNAIKHGALSNLDGRIHISWGVKGNGGDSQLIFHWREQGGPPVGDPKRQGFGSTLLRTTFANARPRFEAGGFSCELEVPLRQATPLPPLDART